MIAILASLVWIAGVIVCCGQIYRCGIEEGMRRCNKPLDAEKGQG